MKLIVGLGNPGKEYENTRHNAGFLAVDKVLSKMENASDWSMQSKFNALVTKGSTKGVDILLAKPQTYMNLSGEAVQAIASYYKVPTEDILIVHDELDLAPGAMAFIAKGGHAGHNGIADIHERLATQGVQRLRLGIGRPTPPQAVENWVLGKIDQATLDIIPQAAEAAIDWAATGIDKAMNTWHRKPTV